VIDDEEKAMTTGDTWRLRGGVAVLCGLLAWSPVPAQEERPTLPQAVNQFYAGQWEQATAALYQLLQTGGLSQAERSQARKFIGLGHILRGQEDRAVAVFKDLVRDDPNFDMRSLAIEGEALPAPAIRSFGQAVVEVRQEEIRAWEAQLRTDWRQGAFLRSVVLPGWGQRYKGYGARSLMLMGLTAASIGYAVWADLSYRDAREAYDDAPSGSDFEKLYDEYQSQADRADRALGMIGGVWLLNVIDAAIQGPNLTQPQLSLQVPARGDGVQVVYLRRF